MLAFYPFPSEEGRGGGGGVYPSFSNSAGCYKAAKKINLYPPETLSQAKYVEICMKMLCVNHTTALEGGGRGGRVSTGIKPENAHCIPLEGYDTIDRYLSNDFYYSVSRHQENRFVPFANRMGAPPGCIHPSHPLYQTKITLDAQGSS